MNPQERDVINGIFDRLKQAEGQSRDPEADALIAERLAGQPGAAYLLAQIVHVQEQALTNLNDRVNALEAEVEQAKAAPASGGGFLSSLFGAPTPPAAQQARPGARPGPRPAGSTAPGAGPWGGRQAGGPDQAGPNQAGPNQAGPWGNRGAAGGGGFLASAMTTAAGVAGGLVLGNVLTNAFGLNDSSSASAADQTAAADNAAAADEGAQEFAADDASYQEASYDEGGFDDFGGDDSGGGDDWA